MKIKQYSFFIVIVITISWMFAKAMMYSPPKSKGIMPAKIQKDYFIDNQQIPRAEGEELEEHILFLKRMWTVKRNKKYKREWLELKKTIGGKLQISIHESKN